MPPLWHWQAAVTIEADPKSNCVIHALPAHMAGVPKLALDRVGQGTPQGGLGAAAQIQRVLRSEESVSALSVYIHAFARTFKQETIMRARLRLRETKRKRVQAYAHILQGRGRRMHIPCTCILIFS